MGGPLLSAPEKLDSRKLALGFMGRISHFPVIPFIGTWIWGHGFDSMAGSRWIQFTLAPESDHDKTSCEEPKLVKLNFTTLRCEEWRTRRAADISSRICSHPQSVQGSSRSTVSSAPGRGPTCQDADASV